MKTGKLVKYVIKPGVALILLLEDGTEVEVRIGEDVALVIGDDIFHALYAQMDDERRRIHKITRTLDPASGQFLESADEIEYASEESEE